MFDARRSNRTREERIVHEPAPEDMPDVFNDLVRPSCEGRTVILRCHVLSL